MTTISVPLSRTRELSKTTKTWLSISAIVAVQLATIYLLIPVGIELWRSIVCPGC
jgi:hypothetical protein